jgi:hypothetical protein
MASIDFPNSPTVGQVFTSGTRSWVWTGTVWDVAKETSIGSVDLFLLMGA